MVEVVDDRAAKPCTAPPSLRLRMLAPHECAFALDQGINRLGSALDNDIVIDATGVSRRHAEILLSGSRAVIVDQASKNGLQVDGNRVSRAQIEIGSEVAIGVARLSVESAPPLVLAIELDSVGDKSVTPVATAPAAARAAGADTATRCLADGVDDLQLIDDLVQVMLVPRPDRISSTLDRICERTGAGWGLLLCCASDSRARPCSRSVLGSSGLSRSRLSRVAREPITEPDPSEPTSRREMPGSSAVVDGGQAVATLGIAPGRWLVLELGELDGPSGDLPRRLKAILGLLALVVGRPSSQPMARCRRGPTRLDFPSTFIVGRSPAAQALYAQMAPLARSSISLLLIGETGVGKEQLARTVHRTSGRAGEWVAINCAAIPETMIESELFGVVRGAATGVEPRVGAFGRADGGTLFLDEIGELPTPIQAKLLRALQEREVQPVGGRPQPVDVRVVSATNVDLATRIDAGSFRADLFYRLCGAQLAIPPLRSCPEDIPRMIEGLLRGRSREVGKRLRGVSADALAVLVGYAWPGNVRELENEINRLVLCCPPRQPVTTELLSPTVLCGRRPDTTTIGGAGELDLSTLEANAIHAALERSSGNQAAAARLLGISRFSLRRRLERLVRSRADT